MRTLLIVFLLSSFLISTLAWPRWRGRCSSDQDCPSSHPDCSAEGFCQCESDQPCWDQQGGGGSPATTYPASPSPNPPSYTTLEAPSPGYSAPKAPSASPPTDSYQEPSFGHIKQPEESSYLPPSPPQSFSPAPAAPPAPAPAPAPSLAGSCKSDQDCPASHPICSEWNFCQCPSYKPGGVGCWDLEAVGLEGHPTPPPPPALTAPATAPAQGYPSRPPTPLTAPAPLEQKYEDHYGSSLQMPQHGYHAAEPVQGHPIPPPPPPPQAAAPTLEEGVCSSDADCSSESPICSEFGFCQCPSYRPGGKGCWDLEAVGPEGYPTPPPPPAPAAPAPAAPAWGYPGQPPNPTTAPAPAEVNYGDHYGSPAQIPQHGYLPVQGYPIPPPPPPPQAAAPTLEEGVCSSDADCSSENPICSEFGFCQCPSYKPGGEGCWDLEAPIPPENLSPPPPPPAPASAPVEEKYEDHYGYPAVPSYRGPLQTPL